MALLSSSLASRAPNTAQRDAVNALAVKLGMKPENKGLRVIVAGVEFKPHKSWAQGGQLKEIFCIGSEGGSAWGWMGDVCLGRTGKTELEAICNTVSMMLDYSAQAGIKFNINKFKRKEYPFDEV